MTLVEFLARRKAFVATWIARRRITQGAVTVNGEKVEAHYLLQHGDRIEVLYSTDSKISFDYLTQND